MKSHTVGLLVKKIRALVSSTQLVLDHGQNINTLARRSLYPVQAGQLMQAHTTGKIPSTL